MAAKQSKKVINMNEDDLVYNGFADVYDEFMDNVPYGEWSDFIAGLLGRYGIHDGLVLDLGCGTGNMTSLLFDAGYDMIGVDNSEEMLSIAMDKCEDSGRNILYLLQDMREFELYGTVRAVVSVCDSMNYITEENELVKVFSLVNNYLDPGGIFIFDMNTIYKYRELMGNNTIAENREDASFIWENCFDEDELINEYALTVFVREKDDLFRKYEEFHYQRAYEIDFVKDALKRAGLEFVGVYDAYTGQPVREDSERVYFVARECTKHF
ncbi:MAG: class I SAM-dependent methyltransferase [Lachnospiraceae bacterium]|nr:class I SAM-dependent methyltransferase [Lachnospiraceae bacterium]